MIFDRPKEKIFTTLVILWPSLLTAFGLWWVYLFFLMGEELKQITLKNGSLQVNLSTLVRFEGPVFLALLILTTLALIITRLRERKHHQQWQLFFASISHELRTPLASIQLQAEVLKEKIENLQFPEKVSMDTLCTRLLEDSSRLEHQFNQILELARPESPHPMPLTPINLEQFFQSHSAELIGNHKSELYFEFQNIAGQWVMANRHALIFIFKNLLSNTLRYRNPAIQRPITLRLESIKNYISLFYTDHGKNLDLDLKLLGKPYPNLKTKKGLGLGLFLVNKLMVQMRGSVHFYYIQDEFTVEIRFLASKSIQ